MYIYISNARWGIKHATGAYSTQASFVYRLPSSLAMLSFVLDEAKSFGFARLGADSCILGPSLLDGPLSLRNAVQVCSVDAS